MATTTSTAKFKRFELTYHFRHCKHFVTVEAEGADEVAADRNAREALNPDMGPELHHVCELI